MFTEIAFPPYEGLPFEHVTPTVDGYVTPEKWERDGQTGVPRKNEDVSHPREVGYTHGGGFSWEQGAGLGTQGSPAAFQGVWDPVSTLLYIGFQVRYDLSFDQTDRLVVVLRDNAGLIRRIDVQPNDNAGGAKGTADPLPPGTPAGVTPTADVRTGRDPHQPPTFYVPKAPGSAGPPWVSGSQPLNFAVKVRSVLDRNPGAGDSGRYWSIELQIPTHAGDGSFTGGPDWLNLGAQFQMYVNLIRVGVGNPIFLDDEPTVQSAWPWDAADHVPYLIVDPPSGPLTLEEWPITKFGTVTLVQPGQPNPAKGVKFQQGVGGIGVLQPGGGIGDLLDLSAPNNVNTFVARLVNTDDVNPAPPVRAEFRLADFGVGGGSPGVWGKPGSVPNPSAAVPVPGTAGGTVSADLTSTWTITQDDIDKYKGLWNDQCLWVLLTANGPATLVEESMRRNLRVKTMSGYDGGFVVSGEGWPGPHGGDHRFLLHSVRVPIATFADDPAPQDPPPDDVPPIGLARRAPEPGGGESPLTNLLNQRGDDDADPQSLVTWLWVTNAYRDTGRTLTFGDRRTRVYTHAGSFAYFFVHQLEAGETSDTITLSVDYRGGGIEVGDGGIATIRVPDGGRAVVGTGFEVVPVDESGGGASGYSFWRWLLRLIRLLINWFRHRSQP